MTYVGGNRFGGSRRRHGVQLGALLLAATLSLSACAAGAAAPAESDPVASARPLPSVSAPPSIISAPQQPSPRMELRCDTALSDTDAAVLLGPGVVELSAVSDVSFASPITATPLNAGALLCSWGNSTRSSWWTPSPDFHGATLRVVPVSDEQWASYGPQRVENPDEAGAINDYPGEELWSWCWEADEYGGGAHCYFEGLVNGYWLEFQSDGVGGSEPHATEQLHELLRPLLDRVVGSLNATELPAAWQSPEIDWALPTECDSILSVEQAELFTGHSPLLVGTAWDGPRRGLGYFAMKELAALKCDLMFADSDSTIGQVYAMDRGAWRAAQLNAELIELGRAHPVTLVGLAGPDSAALDCGDAEASCALNLSYRGHWIQLAIPPTFDSEGARDATQARERIVEMAEAVIANLNATAG